jgi:valyl-tRNA synthetase
MNEALAGYRFHEATFTIYHFFWHELCDWYLEWVKPEITILPKDDKLPPAWVNLARVFDAALHLLHPFMPFITEELWSRLPRGGKETSLSLAPFSLVSDRAQDPISEKQFQTVQELITTVRNAKAERGLQTQKPSAQVASEDLRILELFRKNQETILRFASFQAMNFTRGRLNTESGGVRATTHFDVRVFHDAQIDPAAERARLLKEKEKLEKGLAQIQQQLENQEFMSRAPKEVVRNVEKRHAELTAQLRRVLDSLERLG